MKIWNLYTYSPDLFNYTFDMWVESQSGLGVNYALRQINEEGYMEAEIHNFTKAQRRKDRCHQGLRFVSHPLSFPWLPRQMKLKEKRVVLYGFGRQSSISFLKYLLKQPPALVHLFVTDGYFNYLLTRILRRLHIPYILEFPGKDLTPTFFRWRLVKGGEAIIVYTEKFSSEIQKRYRLPAKTINIIPPGIDLNKFFPQRPSSNEDFPNLLFVGQIYPFKGVLEAVKALQHIKSYFSKATLKLVGRVVDEEYAQELRTLIAKHSLEGSVDFLNFREKNELPHLYSKAHLFIFPSRSEGMPQVVLESMACGTPVVTLKGAGAQDEIINNGANGILTTPKQLNQEVLNLLKDKKKLQSMQDQATKKIAQNYSREITYQRLKNLYEKILKKYNKSATFIYEQLKEQE